MSNRYEASGGQSEFQPGSDGQVLQNLLGIISPEEINDIELDLLNQLYQSLFTKEFPDRRLTVADLKSWHYRWLGKERYFAAIQQGLAREYSPMIELISDALKD